MAKNPQERADELLAKQVRLMAAADKALWRHSLAEATVSLLEQGMPVTVETLIARLEQGFSPSLPHTNEARSEAAIERLRAIKNRDASSED